MTTLTRPFVFEDFEDWQKAAAKENKSFLLSIVPQQPGESLQGRILTLTTWIGPVQTTINININTNSLIKKDRRSSGGTLQQKF